MPAQKQYERTYAPDGTTLLFSPSELVDDNIFFRNIHISDVSSVLGNRFDQAVFSTSAGVPLLHFNVPSESSSAVAGFKSVIDCIPNDIRKRFLLFPINSVANANPTNRTLCDHVVHGVIDTEKKNLYVLNNWPADVSRQPVMQEIVRQLPSYVTNVYNASTTQRDDLGDGGSGMSCKLETYTQAVCLIDDILEREKERGADEAYDPSRLKVNPHGAKMRNIYQHLVTSSCILGLISISSSIRSRNGGYVTEDSQYIESHISHLNNNMGNILLGINLFCANSCKVLGVDQSLAKQKAECIKQALYTVTTLGNNKYRNASNLPRHERKMKDALVCANEILKLAISNKPNAINEMESFRADCVANYKEYKYSAKGDLKGLNCLSKPLKKSANSEELNFYKTIPEPSFVGFGNYEIRRALGPITPPTEEITPPPEEVTKSPKTLRIPRPKLVTNRGMEADTEDELPPLLPKKAPKKRGKKALPKIDKPKAELPSDDAFKLLSSIEFDKITVPEDYDELLPRPDAVMDDAAMDDVARGGLTMDDVAADDVAADDVARGGLAMDDAAMDDAVNHSLLGNLPPPVKPLRRRFIPKIKHESDDLGMRKLRPLPPLPAIKNAGLFAPDASRDDAGFDGNYARGRSDSISSFTSSSSSTSDFSPDYNEEMPESSFRLPTFSIFEKFKNPHGNASEVSAPEVNTCTTVSNDFFIRPISGTDCEIGSVKFEKESKNRPYAIARNDEWSLKTKARSTESKSERVRSEICNKLLIAIDDSCRKSGIGYDLAIRTLGIADRYQGFGNLSDEVKERLRITPRQTRFSYYFQQNMEKNNISNTAFISSKDKSTSLRTKYGLKLWKLASGMNEDGLLEALNSMKKERDRGRSF